MLGLAESSPPLWRKKDGDDKYSRERQCRGTHFLFPVLDLQQERNRTAWVVSLGEGALSGQLGTYVLIREVDDRRV